MKKIYILFISFFLITYLPSQIKAASNLEEGVKELAQQISNNMSTVNKKKIAIVEFSDLDGNITAFGQFLAEELITQLFMTSPGQFEVVERRQLMKVLKEQSLTMTGLLDAKAMESVGKILGIEAIVTGSVTDLGNEVKINARLIGIDTAKVFAVASTKIPKVGTVEKLIEKDANPIQIFSSSSKGAKITINQQPVQQKKAWRKFESKGYMFELIGCRITGDKINCTFTILNNKKEEVSLVLSLSSYLYDDLGNQYIPHMVALGGKSKRRSFSGEARAKLQTS